MMPCAKEISTSAGAIFYSAPPNRCVNLKKHTRKKVKNKGRCSKEIGGTTQDIADKK